MKNLFKIALLQTKVEVEKVKTLQHVKNSVQEAVQNGAKLLVFGETFNSIYTKEHLIKNQESLQDTEDQKPSITLIQELAQQNQVYIVAGTIPEKATDQKLYNTSFVFNPKGEIIAKYRKLHLFDIDIPGKITYKESDTFEPGDDISTFDTEFCRIGLGICYDIRFPDLAMLMARQGCQLLIYPGNFNLTTGPLHWELLCRSRALDNQIYFAACASARYTEDPNVYQSWGHSMVVDPMGKILTIADHTPNILYSEIDLDYLNTVRTQIPCTVQRRNDIYELIDKKK